MTRPFRFAVQAFSAPSAKAWREVAQTAEALGYSALHLADHYFGPGPLEAETNHPVQVLAAVPAMAMAAEATESIAIGCRVFCIDYHHPAVLAKEAATLDLLSDGRLELGLGAGWIEAEYRAMGLPWDPPGVRIERLAEVVTLIKAHFGGEQLSVRGKHVQVEGYAGVPRPVHQPRPPIMIGGGAPRVLRLAGREADIVSLNFNNRAGQIGADGVRSSTAEETARKVSWVREGAGDRFDELELEIAAYFSVVTDAASAATAEFGARFGLEVEAMRAHPNALIGSVAEISAVLHERRERFGISYITIPHAAMETMAAVVEALSGK